MIPSLEGYECKSLPLKIRLNIKRAACRIEIIKWNSNYDLRFELFNRLNTGGSPLTNQEIRNSLYRSVSAKFNEFLAELAEDANFKKAVDITDERVKQLYLQELVLRFLSLYNRKHEVKKSIAQHMTDFMKEASENGDFNYSMYSSVFKKTFGILANVGTGIFQSKNHEFSTAIFDTTTIGIAENIHFYGSANSSVIKDRIATIKKDEYYQKITRSGGNNSVQRVKKRLEFAKTIFGKQ